MQMSTVQPTFKLELNHKVTPTIVTIAKYDGTHPCITASAGYDKLIIHHPHGSSISSRAQKSQAHKEVSELNLSQEVVAIAAGPLKPCCIRDMLVIGSPSQILAFDVHDNSDLFFKDAPDGVTTLTCGSLGKNNEVLAIVGGTSSVQGLTWQGEEVFWNVVGGKVRSLLVMDLDKDGENELLIGCEDFVIRVLKNNQIVAEVLETGSVLTLTSIFGGRFAYGLANGTIGVYEEEIRIWRVKSKQNALSLQWSGSTLACCWQNGRIDWRDGTTGRVLRRVQMRSNAAAMLQADYRSVGVADVICISDKGDVLGYPSHLENAASFNTSVTQPSEKDRQAITELFNRKQALLLEMQHYESNAASSLGMDVEQSATAMPANTKLQVAVNTAPDEKCLDLMISTNNETIVRAALILAEGMFETGETLAKHPDLSQLRSRLHIPIRPPRDVSVDVHIKALVGYKESEQFHIFELTKLLPRFSMYTIQPTLGKSKQKNYVTFNITERLQRICLWVNQNFLLEEEFEVQSKDAKELNISFECLRNQERLDMDFNAGGVVTVSTPDIKLASDIVQSLAAYLNIADLESTAHFPEIEQKLRDEMNYISEIGDAKTHLAAETAERAQLITALLPAAQDAGTYNLKEMLTRYKEVVLLNEELLSGCHVRRDNHELALAALKRVHTILQLAARLRVGKHAKAVVSASRAAVKDDNVDALIKVIQVGGA